MSLVYRVPRQLLVKTFAHFRECGQGQRECQVLWVGSWSCPEQISEIAHPKHEANLYGFALDGAWLNAFWLRLGQDNMGIRVQVHTHPREAFHSATDDQYPILHTPGFLSLVIPDFGLGHVGFNGAYLAEIQPNGKWRQVAINDRLVIE